jgi:serine phosphatase RsbU (regulator of sigma subunit)/anti-sigma regulatory factor (Ser/Thr protein kinase)
VSTLRTPRHSVEDQVEPLTDMSDSALSKLNDERNASVALQRSLVPEQLPDIPGLAMSSRYRPAEDGGVGGDWYDIFTLPSGHVCITIGDVAGRGLRAAGVMGRLRSTVRAYAMEVIDPPELLARVDRKLQHFEPSEMATVLFAVFDPSLQHMRISLAGHPAPVLAVDGEPAHFIDVPVDPPLGVSRIRERHGTTLAVPQGGNLCFFTDGLVERRTIPLDDRLAQLVDTVTADPPDEVCRCVMTRLVKSEPTGDDIAMLVIRRLALSEIGTFDLEVPAVPGSLSRIRVAMRRWLAVVDAGPEDVVDILTAAGEACSNAVEHAYGARQGTVGVRMELDRQSNAVVVTVRDTGSWRPSRGGNRGRGTRLMELSSDQVDIRGSLSGTEVVIRRHLGQHDTERIPV